MHAIPTDYFHRIVSLLSKNHTSREYAVDSFPIPVISDVRIVRAKCFKGKEYYGYSAIRKKRFYGLRVHMVASIDKKVIEFSLEPANKHDLRAFKRFTLNLPSKSVIYADKAYNDYKLEENLLKEKQIILAAKRKKNLTKPSLIPVDGDYKKRRIIETMFSLILNLTGRTIQAVTKKGFELKIRLFICAYSFFA